MLCIAAGGEPAVRSETIEKRERQRAFPLVFVARIFSATVHCVAAIEEATKSEDGIDLKAGQGFADTLAASSEVSIAVRICKVKDGYGMALSTERWKNSFLPL